MEPDPTPELENNNFIPQVQSTQSIPEGLTTDTTGGDAREGLVTTDTAGGDDGKDAAAIKVQAAFRGFTAKAKSVKGDDKIKKDQILNQSQEDKSLNLPMLASEEEASTQEQGANVAVPAPPGCPSPSKTSFRTEKLVTALNEAGETGIPPGTDVAVENAAVVADAIQTTEEGTDTQAVVNTNIGDVNDIAANIINNMENTTEEVGGADDMVGEGEEGGEGDGEEEEEAQAAGNDVIE